MTFTVIGFAYRKKPLSPTEFKWHYENSHLPLLKSLAGEDFPVTHTRRYIQRTSDPSSGNEKYPATILLGQQSDFDYDAVVEMVFENGEHFQRFMKRMYEPDGLTRLKSIKEDEELFLDEERLRFVVVGSVIVDGR